MHHVHLCQVQIRLPTLALKPRCDITRSPKQEYQWPLKDTCPPKCFKKRLKKKTFISSVITSMQMCSREKRVHLKIQMIRPREMTLQTRMVRRMVMRRQRKNRVNLLLNNYFYKSKLSPLHPVSLLTSFV